MNTTAVAPLSGIRVLELGTMYAAPTAGRMLRDFDVHVTKYYSCCFPVCDRAAAQRGT